MKFLIFFWICSAVCDKNPITNNHEPYVRRSQKVIFYDSLTEASLAQRRLLLGMKLEEYGIGSDEQICSDVTLWNITKEIKSGGAQ